MLRNMLMRCAYDNDKRDPGMINVETTQLLNSDTKGEEFTRFMED